MTPIKRLVAAIAMALCAPLAAQVTPQEQAALDEAERLGEAIYLHDQAAWHATDALNEAVSDPAALGVRGWIVNDAEDGLEVVFYRRADVGFEAVWSGVYDGQRIRDQRRYDAAERALNADEEAMIAARLAPFTVESGYSLCAEQINFVILPSGKPDGGLYVYLLNPQPALDQIPFGGHFRFEVVNGEVVAHRKFANSCLTMSNASQERGRPAALTISHLLDDTPTEIHVFAMYAAQVPVYVITTENEKLWSVELIDGKPAIRAVSRE